MHNDFLKNIAQSFGCEEFVLCCIDYLFCSKKTKKIITSIEQKNVYLISYLSHDPRGSSCETIFP